MVGVLFAIAALASWRTTQAIPKTSPSPGYIMVFTSDPSVRVNADLLFHPDDPNRPGFPLCLRLTFDLEVNRSVRWAAVMFGHAADAEFLELSSVTLRRNVLYVGDFGTSVTAVTGTTEGPSERRHAGSNPNPICFRAPHAGMKLSFSRRYMSLPGLGKALNGPVTLGRARAGQRGPHYDGWQVPAELSAEVTASVRGHGYRRDVVRPPVADGAALRWSSPSDITPPEVLETRVDREAEAQTWAVAVGVMLGLAGSLVAAAWQQW